MMKYIDAHLHAVNFLQETEGLEKLLECMDQAGVEKAVVFGLPVKKKWQYYEPEKPHYYLDGYSRCYYFSRSDEIVAENYLRLSPAQQQRIIPLLCAFDPTDLYAVDYLRDMKKKYPFWRGVGELLLRHDDLSIITADEQPRVNHPALQAVFEFCTAENWPVLVHHNGASVGYDHLLLYRGEMEEVLQHHPELKMIWAHCGASRRTEKHPYHEMAEDMLGRYPRLHMDISWIVYDRVVCDENGPKENWLSLIEKFADRFLIGSDLTGHFGSLLQKIHRYEPLLQRLPAAAAEKLRWRNAERLWN